MKVLIINGMGGSGKDTFVNYLKEYINLYHCSIVELPKRIAKKMGWNGEKDEKSRKFLSDLKIAIDDYNNLNYEYTKREIKRTLENHDLVCVDIREPKQIQKMKEEFDAITVFIKRDVPMITSNPGDAGVYDYEYDFTIENNGSLDDLKHLAKLFAKVLGEEFDVKVSNIENLDENEKEETDFVETLVDYFKTFVKENESELKELKDFINKLFGDTSERK